MDLPTLTKVEVCARLGIKDPRTLDALVADGDFPPGFPAGRGLGERWFERDLDAYLWLQMRCTQRQPKPKRKRKAKPEPPPS